MTWGVKSDYAITRIPGSGALDMPQGLGVRQSSGALNVTIIPCELE
jgi:hypothetical protein